MAKVRFRAKGKGNDRGYTFTTDGQEFRARTIQGIVRHVAHYRTEHGGDLAPDWDQRLLAQIKEVYPTLVAVESVGYSDGGAKYLSVMAFFRQVKAHGKKGRSFVSEEEARRRRDICLQCKLRTNLVACGSCRTQVAKMFFKVPEDFDFGIRAYCGACHCSLAHKTWLLPEVLASDPREISYPDHCWVPHEAARVDEAPHTEA